MNSLLSDFKENIIRFLDELVEQFKYDTQLIEGRTAIYCLPADFIMKMFIENILPFKDEIVSRNDIFFIERASAMFPSKNECVNHFRVIWKSSKLDDEDRTIIWEWFDLFVMFAERYKKLSSK